MESPPVLADPLASSRTSRALVALVRVGVALMWMQNPGWKDPPGFSRGEHPSGLYQFTRWAVDYPVLPP